jgi:biopolymer transport protein ExbB
MSAAAELFRLGGPLMWPLALCSVLLMAFLVERAITAAGPAWRTDERQRTLHRRHLLFFVEVAPALGLLGTMQGIIECFQVLGGRGSASGALEGLGVACITTVYGLLIALAAQVASYVLDSVGRADALAPSAGTVAPAGAPACHAPIQQPAQWAAAPDSRTPAECERVAAEAVSAAVYAPEPSQPREAATP